MLRELTLALGLVVSSSNVRGAEILTPKRPDVPRINGARMYGQRPGRPLLFTIPATGEEPITYSADGLPDGLVLDVRLGRITGSVAKPGQYKVTLTASNRIGKDSKPLLIQIGDRICLTPPMGWNSWNCYGGTVDQEKVRAQAEAMVRTGLIRHGWACINIDDTWQGQRGGKYNALQGNEKFPDMKKLCDQIHALGLKAGIYSTPWVTSYARHPGGSAENPQGAWSKPPPRPRQVNRKVLPYAVGKYSFAREDARQWADWGFDYLKYDWNPIEVPQVREMADALNSSGRDFVYSLSNHAPFSGAPDWARLANCWRTGGDIRDTWKSVVSNGFSQEKWAPFAGPGHFNDPDMLVVGMVGWGARQHPTRLTPDEQYTHITLWCLLSAPLLLGCDLTRLDDFTLSLLTNDEVLAVDQDPLCRQATRMARPADTQVWAKPLSDGAWAVGLFNLGDKEAAVTLDFGLLKLAGPQPVRDLWRQKDLGTADGHFTAHVPPHGAAMLRVGKGQRA